MKIQIALVIIFALNMLLLDRFAWYRVIGSLLFIVIPLATVVLPQPRFELDYFWWRVAGYVCIALGVGVIAWSKRELGKIFPQQDEPPQELVTTGPYHYIRHPMYLGLIFVFVGWWWIWAAVYAFYFGMFILAMVWIQGYIEEKFILEKHFAEKYAAYRRKAGMFWIR